MKMLWCAIIVIFLLSSCLNSNRHDVGQFVYVTRLGTIYPSIIHINRECAALSLDYYKTKEERIMNDGVVFIDTCNLRYGGNDSYYECHLFCPKCVDDEAYKHIKAIMGRNYAKSSGY